MRISKTIFIGLMMLISYQSYVMSQNTIDSLRSILDKKGIPDSTYVTTTIKLCGALVNTDSSFLLPEYAIKGLIIDTLNKDIQSKFALYEYLGNYYWQVGKLTEAADQFNHMRLIGETNSDNHIAANSYMGLGTVYYQISDFKKALEYYRKGLSIAGNDSLLRARFYTNLANTFLMMDNMDSVLLYYNNSVQYHSAHQNYKQLSITYGNIALAYLKLHDRREIGKYINLALDAADKTRDSYQIASIYQLMGDITLTQHPDMAAKSYQVALGLARKTKSYSQIRKNLESLSYLAENDGHYKEALAYIQEVKNLDDTINLEQKRTRIQRLEYDHLAALRQAEEMEKEHEDTLKQERNQNRQKTLLTIVSIAFIASVLVLLMFLYTYRLRIKMNRSKEKFFSMIAHDIRNPFSGILGLSGILNEEAQKSEDLTRRKQMGSLHKSLNQVYELLENLLQWSQSESRKVAFDPQVQLLSPFVHEVICLHNESAKQKGITLVNQIQTGLTARFDSNMLKTIMRNLLSNAIKFSPDSTIIITSAFVQGKEVVVRVQDQGVGMNEEQIERMFTSDRNLSTPGTRNETGTGLGLILCRNFIARHGGKIWADSKLHEGTTVSFTLPD
jgi:signal transduction histidine kinase